MNALERASGTCLLIAAFLAPWLAGARTSLGWALLPLEVLIGAALVLLVAQRVREKRPLQVSRVGLALILVFFACLAWWYLQDDPPFATTFAAEHWAFLETQFPGSLLLLPRTTRLGYLATALIAIVVAMDLGRRDAFRQAATLVIGSSGLLVAVYCLAQRYLGWAPPGWVTGSFGPDSFIAAYFNHGAAVASLNVAWPLLVFGPLRRLPPALRWGATAVIVAIVALALPLWEATSGYAVAGGLAVAGLAGSLLASRDQLSSRTVAWSIVGVIAAVTLFQFTLALRLQRQSPDRWEGVEATTHSAEQRDEAVRRRSLERGDRMVTSGASPRITAWVTAIRMAGDHPVVGEGPGSWVHRATLYSNEPIMATFHQHRQFAHNDLFQTAAEWGLLPAILWLGFWAGAVFRLAERDPESFLPDLPIGLALLGLALHALMHYPLQVGALQLWAALLLGLGWSRPPRRRSGVVL